MHDKHYDDLSHLMKINNSDPTINLRYYYKRKITYQYWQGDVRENLACQRSQPESL